MEVSNNINFSNTQI
jgi:hypothetical protein